MRPRKLMGLWIDTTKAVLVKIEDDETDIRTLKSGIDTHERIDGESGHQGRFGDQFVAHERTKENRLEESESRFIDRLISEVAGGDQLIVFGPAQMKVRFEKAFKAKPAPKPNLRAVEAADSMTDNQVAAYVRDFYGKSSGAAF